MRHKYEYDAFISHAVEDKIPIANELCAKLEKAGLRVWYSGKELGIGDSIEKTIEKGLNRSRYGIVIFSPTYLAKNWTIREFYTLLAREINERKVILPVLYNITLNDLKNKDLLMADRFAVDADRGLDFVVEKLIREIKKPEATVRRVAWFSRMWLVLALSLLANVAFLLKSLFASPVPTVVADNPDTARSHGPWDAEALAGQMATLARSLNDCTCPERTHSENPVIRNVSHHYNSPGQDEGYLSTDQQPGRKERPSKRAQKMTMALVFQVETDVQPEHEEADRGLAEILHAINKQSHGKAEIALSQTSHRHGRVCPAIREEAE